MVASGGSVVRCLCLFTFSLHQPTIPGIAFPQVVALLALVVVSYVFRHPGCPCTLVFIEFLMNGRVGAVLEGGYGSFMCIVSVLDIALCRFAPYILGTHSLGIELIVCHILDEADALGIVDYRIGIGVAVNQGQVFAVSILIHLFGHDASFGILCAHILVLGNEGRAF